MPTALMITCGTMIATITASWKYQLVVEPKSGTGTSAGQPPMRVAAPMM